ncbi:MAG: NAD(P)-dependent oxidoreductase [Nitrospirae bacterium]|nr:NAD(P)-dependent oxidoreductase [Nitrospirota bacterium]MCL5976722.1 NAD(P)-dependent oxidoreductase [Nitrospirota bacterium]
MKIFITGATGFIGRHAVSLLTQNNHDLMLLIRRHGQNPFITAADNKQISVVYGDLSDIEGWRKFFIEFKPDALLHIAWEGLPNYGIEMCRLNFNHGLNLFLMAAKAGCGTIMSIGSCWEYREKKGALHENSTIDSTKAFPAFKNALRITGEAIAREYKIRFYWPRLFFVYGPGQREASLIPSIIRAVSLGETPNIKNYANKNDFIYVEDVAAALVKIIQKKPDGIIYNIGSGFSTAVLDVLSLVYETMGYKKNYIREIKAVDNSMKDDFWADTANIRKDVGWTPNFSLTDGIKNTVHYFADLEKSGVVK